MIFFSLFQASNNELPKLNVQECISIDISELPKMTEAVFERNELYFDEELN